MLTLESWCLMVRGWGVLYVTTKLVCRICLLVELHIEWPCSKPRFEVIVYTIDSLKVKIFHCQIIFILDTARKYIKIIIIFDIKMFVGGTYTWVKIINLACTINTLKSIFFFVKQDTIYYYGLSQNKRVLLTKLFINKVVERKVTL